MLLGVALVTEYTTAATALQLVVQLIRFFVKRHIPLLCLLYLVM